MTEKTANENSEPYKNIEFNHPKSQDGYYVNELVKNCKPLDENSVYCNLLQCEHFSGTSLCAKYNGDLCGFASGYLIPQNLDTLFVWQVAVSGQYRGLGIGIKLIERILEADACKNVKYLQTTITKSNNSSWRLFEKLAQKLSTQMNSKTFFTKSEHFQGEHESEELVTIGPF